MTQVLAEIEADRAEGGWDDAWLAGARWLPTSAHAWTCWAAVDAECPCCSYACDAKVAAHDHLGLCAKHRAALVP